MEYLQRMFHASRERLPLLTPGSVHFFGLAYALYDETIIPKSAEIFSNVFSSNILCYYPDFTYEIKL